jgi:membrane protease YdiL (CAAX protease family)
MTVANPPLQSASPYKSLLARHPLVFFFIIIAYAGSWLFAVPAALSEAGVGLLPVSSLVDPVYLYVLSTTLGTFLGPCLSGFVMTGVTEGREGIRRLLRRIVLWRVGLRWYLFALIGLPAILLLGAIVLPGALASFQGLAPTIVTGYLFFFAYVFFIGGGLNEEPGWRGFALPRLQRLHGPLVGSLILGPLWGVWHLPIFWVTFYTPPTILNIVLFVFAITCTTIVMTWFFNNTKGSVFMAIVLHASNNAFYAIVPAIFSASIVIAYGGMVPLIIAHGTLALVLIALTRGRLGYDHYLQEAEGEPDPATARW